MAPILPVVEVLGELDEELHAPLGLAGVLGLVPGSRHRQTHLFVGQMAHVGESGGARSERSNNVWISVCVLSVRTTGRYLRVSRWTQLRMYLAKAFPVGASGLQVGGREDGVEGNNPQWDQV